MVDTGSEQLPVPPGPPGRPAPPATPDEVDPTGRGGDAGSPRPASAAGSPLRAPAVVAVGGGVVLGVAWRLLTPVLASVGDPVEARAAVDGTFMLLAALAGLVTALRWWRRPGPVPPLRLVLLLAAGLLGSALAAGVGPGTGGPSLLAWGALLVWPVTTSVVALAVTAGRLLVTGE